MSSNVVRIPEEVHRESKQIAALRGEQAGALLAKAWREYFEKHRDEFAADLETAARLLRDGTAQDLAAFANRNVAERARLAVEQAADSD